MFVIRAEDLVNVVKEIAPSRDALFLGTLLKEDEVIDIHVGVAEALALPPGREGGEMSRQARLLCYREDPCCGGVWGRRCVAGERVEWMRVRAWCVVICKVVDCFGG